MKQRGSDEQSYLAVGFKLAVVGGLFLFLGTQAHRQPELFLDLTTVKIIEILFWTVVVAVVELLPVPVSKTLQLSLSYPLLLAAAILYQPVVVGAIAVIGSIDSRELRGELPLLTSLFNRCQIAFSAVSASVVFHTFASVRSPMMVLLPTVIMASTSAYAVNVVLVALYMRLVYRQALPSVLSQLRVGGASPFLLNHLGLGLIGVVIASLYTYSGVGIWSVVAFVLPLVFARQMFFRTMALEDAGKELEDRQRVLRALSNRMAEERQDERLQIAAYLHDDLAQMLFRLNLQVEMAKKRLASGELDGVLKDLEGITETKELTSQAVRALIRDLHRSPIGRKGLAEAIRSFAADISNGSKTRIATDVVEVSLPPPIQLLIYQIAREAAMNALNHADARNVWISLRELDEGVELQIRDDGKGFDTEAPPSEGHFGSVMMRERALVAGGTFSVRSETGRGSIITAGFPRVWVEEATLLEASSQAAETQEEEADETAASMVVATMPTAEGGPGRRQRTRSISAQGQTHPDSDQDQRDRRPVPA